ncbi:MAG TPA: hypothetical protein VKB93_12775 [Thermoanaerobaculia bacterium]|nr:hypothetical protein [Thermoanaerobaculia bacterium]
MRNDQPELTARQIEESVRAALERMPQQAASVVTALELQNRSAMRQEERTVLLSMEIFAAEGANLAAWLLHLRGEHAQAREMVRVARVVQQAVSDALARG